MQMVHHAGVNMDKPGQVLWNQRYQYALDSNRLLATSMPGDQTTWRSTSPQPATATPTTTIPTAT